MSARSFRPIAALLGAALTAAALGCGEDVTQPVTTPDGAAEAGPGATPAVEAVAALSFLQLGAGWNMVCGVASDNRGYCWGGPFHDRPVALGGTVRFKDVRAGLTFGCGLGLDDKAYCWGWNTEGQLGSGATVDYSVDPAPVAGFRRYRLLRVGAAHACAITFVNVTYCWGSNTNGQVGDGTTTNRNTPVKLASGVTFDRVTTGALHTCGLTAAGKAYCWGKNQFGQLGIANSIDQHAPTAVTGGLTFKTLSAGGRHSCAVATDDVAYCWGYNGLGALGDGTRSRHGRPEPVAGGLKFRGVSAGGSHSCGTTLAKKAYCWGYNWYGGVGDGTDMLGGEPFVQFRLAPTAVSGGLTFDAVLAGGDDFTCGLVSGAAYCWGQNNQGTLGDGTEDHRPVPGAVIGPM